MGREWETIYHTANLEKLWKLLRNQQFCSLMRNLYKSATDDLTKVWKVRDWRHAAFSQESRPTQPHDIIQEKSIKTKQVIVNLLI